MINMPSILFSNLIESISYIQQLATVVSVVVNRKLNVSIYDKITQLRNLPYMPELPNR